MDDNKIKGKTGARILKSRRTIAHRDKTDGRDPYWDNVKLVLISLVVLGHFILPVRTDGKSIQTVYHWIYLFHMPAFVFVSGYFSKSFVKKDRKEYKLLGYLGLFVFFTVCLWIISFIFKGEIVWSEMLSTSGAPWYLLAMFFWQLMLIFVSKLSPVFALISSVAISLFAGTFTECGNFLAISRVIVFFPFFLLGYYFNGELIYKIKPWMRVIGALILIAVGIGLWFRFDLVSPYIRTFYARISYAELKLTTLSGMAARLVWYLVALLMTASLLCVIPNHRFKITYIGERTLGVYIVHRLIRDIINNLGLYKYFGHDAVLLAVCFAISIAVVFIASIKPITSFLKLFFKMKFLIIKTSGQPEV